MSHFPSRGTAPRRQTPSAPYQPAKAIKRAACTSRPRFTGHPLHHDPDEQAANLRGDVVAGDGQPRAAFRIAVEVLEVHRQPRARNCQLTVSTVTMTPSTMNRRTNSIPVDRSRVRVGLGESIADIRAVVEVAAAAPARATAAPTAARRRRSTRTRHRQPPPKCSDEQHVQRDEDRRAGTRAALENAVAEAVGPSRPGSAGR